MSRSAFLGGMKVNPKQLEASARRVAIELGWLSAKLEAIEDKCKFVMLDSLDSDIMKMIHAFGLLGDAMAVTISEINPFAEAMATIPKRHKMSSRKGKGRNKFWQVRGRP